MDTSRWISGFCTRILDFPENSLPDIVRFAAQDHARRSDGSRSTADRSVPRRFARPPRCRFSCASSATTPATFPTIWWRASWNWASRPSILCSSFSANWSWQDAGDVPFVLAALRVRDRRVLEALTQPAGERSARRRAVSGNVRRSGGDSGARSRAGANTGGRSALACAHSSGHRRPLRAPAELRPNPTSRSTFGRCIPKRRRPTSPRSKTKIGWRCCEKVRPA